MKIYDITKEARDDTSSNWVGSPGRSTGLYWKQDPTGEYPEGMLRAGPPYPNEEKPMVRQMQQGLEELGYNVGRTGADGKYGPRTTKAVAAFKADYNVPGSPMNFGNAGFAKLKDVLSGKITQLKPEKRTKIDTTAKGGGEIGPMNTVTMWNPKLDGPPSVTQGKVGNLLDVIAEPESGGRYDSVYPGRRNPKILDMTLTDLYKDMKARTDGGKRSSASGRYQYIRKTLKSVVKSMGLDPNKTKFTPEVQDKIAIYHLRLEHGLDSWLANNYSDEAFLNRLSKTWAGLPKDSSGKSYYKGDGLNKAGVTFPHVMAALGNIRGTVT